MCFKVIVWRKPFSFPQGEHFQMLGCEWVVDGGVLLSSFLQENHFGHFAIVTHWKEGRGGMWLFRGTGVGRDPDRKISRGSYQVAEEYTLFHSRRRLTVRPESNWLEPFL